jgi:enamine deaminase RidA (YjgF/YER057c/UK114 family)
LDRAVSEEAPITPHRIVDPQTLPRPKGYAHAVVAAPGRTVYLAGQTGHRIDDSIAEGLVQQFDEAAANVVRAIEGAGGRPEDLVSMQIFTTDLAGYLARSAEIGAVYRKHFGRHFGATALIEVKGLVGGAQVELTGIAVVPWSGADQG